MADRLSIHGVAARLLPARYLARYMNSLSADLDRLLLPGEETHRSLDQFYVPLRFRETSPDRAMPASTGQKPVDAWDILFRAPRLAIVGEPGSGKTVTLRHMAVALARGKVSTSFISRLTRRHQEQAAEQLLPIYLDLQLLDLHDADLAVPLGQVMAHHGFPGAAGFLNTELHEGRCLLMFDGLEALETPEQVARFSRLLAAYPKALVVIAARTMDSVSQLPGFLCFEPVPFSESDVKSYLDRRLGHGTPASAALLQALERSYALGSLAGNPLLLATMAWAAESDPSPPLHLLELYEPCFAILAGDSGPEPPASGRKAGHAALPELARYFHERRQQQFSEEELGAAVAQAEATVGQASDAHPLLEWLLSGRLMRRTDGKVYSFLRLALQQFLTAQSAVQGKRYAEMVRSSLDDPWWHEVIVLATALVGDATDTVKLIKSSAKPEAMFLAARCAAEAPATPAEVREGLRSALFQLFESEDAAYWQEASLCIAALVFQRSADYFPSLLKDGSAEERERAALVMGRTGTSDWALVPLLSALDPSKQPAAVRRRAAWGLGRLGDRVAVRALADTLKDPDEGVANAAALALSVIGEPAVPYLIPFLSSEENTLRQMSVRALGNMGTLAVTPLLNIVRNEKQPDRTAEGAIEALGLLGDTQAVPDLVRLLRARGGKLAESAARALTRVGEPAVQPLIEALPTQSAELQLRNLIVNALVAIGEPSIAPLIQALQHTSTPVRDTAEKALARIGADASAALVDALRTDNWELRRRIAQVLGQIGDVSLAKPLLDVLKDPDPGVRARVAEILGNVGQEPAVASLIDLVQNDPDEFVRRKAMTALADLHSEAAIRPVIDVLHNAQMRDLAIHVLDQIGEASVAPLITALNESRSEDFQSACATALDTVGARGRFEQQDALIIANVYSHLYTERPPLDKMVGVLERIKWWEPAQQLLQAFSVAQDLLLARSLDDVAQSQERLSWVNQLEKPFRPGIRNVLWGLNNVAQNIYLFQQNSGREGQRDAMISAFNLITEVQETINTQLLGYEKKPFLDIVHGWQSLMEEAIKNLRGRAKLQIVALRDLLPLNGPWRSFG
jgi:HEAT repeat protein